MNTVNDNFNDKYKVLIIILILKAKSTQNLNDNNIEELYHWNHLQNSFYRLLVLVSCSQTFRQTAEGLGTLAALNGQGLP